MPCTKCQSCVRKNNIAYCKCGTCNLCHIGFVCPNQQTWWSERGNPIVQADFVAGQSHGGSGTPLPTCSCKLCFNNRCLKYINNEPIMYYHCGNRCRFGKCKH